MQPPQMLGRIISFALLFGVPTVVQAQTAEKPPAVATAPTAEERKAAQIKKMLDRLPIVTKPMTGTDVEALFNRVGLLPLAESAQKPFADWLALAVTTSDASRVMFEDGPFKEASVKFSAKIETEGYPSRDQGPLIKELRGQALAIDIALITAAAAPIAANASTIGASAAALHMIEQAKLMRRADAADETIMKSGIAIPFATVTPAFSMLGSLDPTQIAAARALLLSDAAMRADLAERVSYAALEEFVLMAGETAIAIQTAARNLPEAERIDGVELTGIAMAIQMGPLYGASSPLANLNAPLEEAFQAQYSPTVAYDVIRALESGPMRSPPPLRGAQTIPDLEVAALALAGITAEQQKSITDIATRWRSAEVQSFVRQAQWDGPLMAQFVAATSGVVASDPTTWPSAARSSNAAAKLDQMVLKRNEQLQSRRDASDRSTKEIEQVVGAELWSQPNPQPNQKPSPQR